MKQTRTMQRGHAALQIIGACCVLTFCTAVPTLVPSSPLHVSLRYRPLLQEAASDNSTFLEEQNFNKQRYLKVFDKNHLPQETRLRAIDRVTRVAAKEEHIDANLIRAVIFVESAYQQHARSAAGAKGLMQITDLTAQYLGIHDPLNPEENIRGGAKYLRKLINQFDGDVSLALAAYNAGPTNVRRFHGIPPFGETRRYVTRVLATYEKLQDT